MVLILAAVWLASGFMSRMMQASRLNAEVRTIQADNSRIAQANLEYQQQLQALSAPDGAEEQARMHNYVKPDEKVYIVAQPSPSPTPALRAANSRTHPPEAAKPNFWGDLWNALSSSFH
ncbi:MAG: FtsB family cell division protein [Candidatus Dormibacteria bacterium]